MANNDMWKWLAIGAILFVVMGGTNLFKTSTNDIDYKPPVTGDQCAITPSYVNTGVDALVPNTAVTPGNFSYIVNGVYVGTSQTPSKNEAIQVIADPYGYLATVKTLTVGCDKNPVNFAFDAYSAATVTIKDSANGQPLTDSTAGGAENESVISVLTNIPVKLQSASLKSTGKMMFIVETAASTSANVSSIKLNGCGATPVAISNYISSSNANSYRAGFEIPAQRNGAYVECQLEMSPASGQTIRGAVETTIYTMETFVDVDGTIKTGVYDSNGNSKYQATYDYDFMIA